MKAEWLAALCYLTNHVVPGAEATLFSVAVCSCQGLLSGPCSPPHTSIATINLFLEQKTESPLVQ